jgi:8-oxo-dGTP pyrophosphatase MutT (NUDIX family)
MSMTGKISPLKVGTLAKAAREGLALLRRGQVSQAAALCYCEREGTRLVLVITGRRSGKFGFPKGTIEAGETSAIAAAREAYEEAGVLGVAQDVVLTRFSYRKDGKRVRRHVAVHPLKVAATTAHFPEAGERKLAWMPAAAACELVSEPALKALLEQVAYGAIAL